MPELPEVETVRAGLAQIIANRPVIRCVRLMRRDIRFPIPAEFVRALTGQRIEGVRRRAKYLIFDTSGISLLSHLGMTGSWRLHDAQAALDPHDHCFLDFDDGRSLVFRDPRRFGLLDLVDREREAEHVRLRDLGVEPLDETAFTTEFLLQVSRSRQVAAKVFIMDQKVVVGIGNIYASEVLFRAGVRPKKIAGRLTREQCARIVSVARAVLQSAIAAGGSSIRDYRDASGEAGDFQSQHLVYDRAGQPCVTCGTKLKGAVVGGRSTFWCQHCQV